MRYVIIKAYSNLELERQVNRYIKENWIPQGGVAIVSETYMDKYLQAMVLNE